MCLSTSIILRQADDTMPFIIKTDASSYAIGAVLVQGEKEEEHPIEYASRFLTSVARNYSTTELEALGIVWAVTRFRGYIEGVETILITDHQPLRCLMTLKTTSGRLARWSLQLQCNNLKIQYSPGRTNTVADFLSRPPCSQHTENCSVCSVQIDLPVRSEKNIREEQLADAELKIIVNALDNLEDLEAHQWFKRGYMLHRGVLYRYSEEQEDDDARLVVPESQWNNILRAYHDDPTAGHYGVEKTFHKILLAENETVYYQTCCPRPRLSKI